jgi:hypothetical protein
MSAVQYGKQRSPFVTVQRHLEEIHHPALDAMYAVRDLGIAVESLERRYGCKPAFWSECASWPISLTETELARRRQHLSDACAPWFEAQR